VDDLDLKRLRIMLHRLKGSLSGEHPLQTDEARALKAWLKHRDTDSPVLFPSRRGLPISRQMLDVLMKSYGEEAAIPKDKRHFHVLKHSIATHLLDAGAGFALCRIGWGTRTFRTRSFILRWSRRAATLKHGSIS
jgi:site-specific recombinase XerD